MALTDAATRNAKWIGKATGDKLHDAGGMYLLVKQAGKYWRMDYRCGGKRKTLSIGVYPAVSLSDARAARDQARELLEQGTDPSTAKRATRMKVQADADNTFAAVAAQWFAQWQVGKAENTRQTALTRLENDIYPVIGKMPINDVTAAMVVAIVKQVNARGARDTAGRTLTRIAQVFRYGVAHSVAERNPATDIKPSDILPAHKVKNHARVSEAQLPQLLRDIYSYGNRGSILTVLALRLLCLTFVRTSDLVEATWDEFDFDNARWNLPASRTKMDTPHVVPLPRQVLAILQELRSFTGNKPYVFASMRSKGKHMSNGTMLGALYRMGYKGVMTGHGFRGVASTILHERGFEHAHIEAQLSHQKRDKVSAAYDHSKYLKQRADLMQWWADYVDTCTADNILTLPRRSA